MSNSLQPHGLHSPWNSPGQDTGASSCSLPQGNLPNPGIEPRPPALEGKMLTTDLQGSAWRGTFRKGQWARLTGGLSHTRSFPGGSEVKASACNVGDQGSIPGLGRFPWRREWQPTPVFLCGEFHGLRSLVGYSPWGCKESDTTE